MTAIQTTQLPPVQKQVVTAIRAMRKLTKENGVRTTYSQNQLLQRLNPDDLAAVSITLEQQ